MNWKGFSFHNQQNVSIDPRLVAPFDVDIRVVMCWDADGIDCELHCIEPNGDRCFALVNQSRSGGHLSRDFTGGLGPEEYLVSKMWYIQISTLLFILLYSSQCQPPENV